MMTETKKHQLTLYFSKARADTLGYASACEVIDKDGNEKQAMYNIELWEGKGALSEDQKLDNEHGRRNLARYPDAIKVGTSTGKGPHIGGLSPSEIKRRLPELGLRAD